jgi:8-amino-7-oxononanoate synthase
VGSIAFYERREENKQVNFNNRRVKRRENHEKVLSPEQRRLASQVRCYEREAFKIPVRVELQGKDFSGYTHDVSPKGILVFSDARLSLGTPLELRFSLCQGVCYLNISGQVGFCRFAENGKSPRQAIGIKFSAIRDFEQKILISAVQNLKENAAVQEQSSLDIFVSMDSLAQDAASFSNHLEPSQKKERQEKKMYSGEASSVSVEAKQPRLERRGFTLPVKAARFNHRLELVKSQGLYLYMRPMELLTAPRVKVNDQEMIMLASMDYLGLTTHPKVKEAAIKAIEKYGTGSGGTSFISRTIDLHEQLEAKLAELKGTQSAMLFGTGFMANAGMVATLFGDKDVLILDEKCHTSTFQGCRNSKCRTRLFRHNDMEGLEKILKLYMEIPGERVILTEGVFSVDGDIANLRVIHQLAQEYDAMVVVDEAQATGVLGKDGRGTPDHHGLIGNVDIITDSLGKALGSFGGCVAASRDVINYLKHFSTNFIFTTSLPPSVCAALLAAIQVVKDEPELRRKVWENSKKMRDGLKSLGFDIGKSETHIIPIMVGDEKKAFEFGGMLQRLGVFVTPVVRPAVKRGEARIRTTVMATHTSADLDKALEAFQIAGKKLGTI